MSLSGAQKRKLAALKKEKEAETQFSLNRWIKKQKPSEPARQVSNLQYLCFIKSFLFFRDLVDQSYYSEPRWVVYMVLRGCGTLNDHTISPIIDFLSLSGHTI